MQLVLRDNLPFTEARLTRELNVASAASYPRIRSLSLVIQP